MDRQYKVRCTGNDDGTYTLSYGKGSKKLTQVVERYGGGTQKWFIPGGSPCTSEEDGTPGPHLVNTLGKLKLAWEAWAKAEYTKGGAEAESTKPASPPTSIEIESDEDEPLPVVGRDGELVAEKNGYEVRVHIRNKRFPYTDGYALIETATRIQWGWTKDRGRAIAELEDKSRETDHVGDTARDTAA